MHAVQAADERGLAAARRTDQRGGVVGLHGDVDVEQCLGVAVKGIQMLDLDSNAHKLCRS